MAGGILKSGGRTSNSISLNRSLLLPNCDYGSGVFGANLLRHRPTGTFRTPFTRCKRYKRDRMYQYVPVPGPGTPVVSTGWESKNLNHSQTPLPVCLHPPTSPPVTFPVQRVYPAGIPILVSAATLPLATKDHCLSSSPTYVRINEEGIRLVGGGN